MLYIKEIINHQIGDNTPFVKVANNLGWKIVRNKHDVEKAYDGTLWEKGYAPLPPEPNYIEKRLTEYPPISDQLDMIYWDSINGTTYWKNMITTIKNKYPKE